MSHNDNDIIASGQSIDQVIANIVVVYMLHDIGNPTI